MRDEVTGDLLEVFRARCASHGLLRARWWYRREAIAFTIRFVAERLRGRRVTSGRHAGRMSTPSMLDIRLGIRMLSKYPGLTVVGGIAFAVGIAVGAAYFEFVNDIWNARLPLPDSDRIVGIQNWDASAGAPQYRSLHDFEMWREQVESIEELGAFTVYERNLIVGNVRTEPVSVAELSASAFRLTPAVPQLGRPLLDSDERPGAPAVAVISDGVWRSRFGGSTDIIGRTVRLGTLSVSIVGVMTADFGFPGNQEVWLPLRARGLMYERLHGPPLRVFGRLAAGASMASAQAELTSIGERVAKQIPGTNEHLRPRVVPYLAMIIGPMPLGVWGIQLLLILILVVACVNVATLMFARTAMRETEITVRTALGASRGRIITQLFVESLVLALVGASAGLLAVRLGQTWGMDIFWDVQGTATPPFWWNNDLAPATIIYAVALAVLAALIAGALPAWRMTGGRVEARLRNGVAGGTARFGGVWTGLIVTQVTLCVILLSGVGSAIVGYQPLRARQAAIDADEYLAARVEMDWMVPPNDSVDVSRFLARFQAANQALRERIAADPSVAAVTFASHLPGMRHETGRVQIEGDGSRADSAGTEGVRRAVVDAHFFEAFGAPVLAGRGFLANAATDRDAVIVNQSFVRLVMGGRNPIARRIRYAGDDDASPSRWYEIIGVVRDLDMNPDHPTQAAGVYHALRAEPGAIILMHPLRMAVHTTVRPAQFAPELRTLATVVDPALRLYDVQSLDQIGRSRQREAGFFVIILVVIVTTALALSMAGVHSLMSVTVSRRTREIGIRAALGARPQRIVAAVFRRAAAQVGGGITAGVLMVATAATLGADNQLNRDEIEVVALVAILMLLAGLFACVLPLHRALRIQPTEALKESR
jgi:predicted permease